MAHIFHWVTKINPTLLASVVIGAVAFVMAAGLIADAIKAGRSEVTLTVHIDNKGTAKAFRVVDNKLVPVGLEKK